MTGRFFHFSDSFSVIPTGVAGLFFRAVRDAPATERAVCVPRASPGRRDPGNHRSSTQLDQIFEQIFAFCYLLSLLLHTLPQPSNCIPQPNLIRTPSTEPLDPQPRASLSSILERE